MKNKTPETTSTRKTNPLRIHDKRKQTLITLPDTKTKIGDYEFNGYAELTTITIPESVTSIGKSAFQNCDKLEHIEIIGNNFIFEDGVLFNHDKTILILCLETKAGDYEIPQTVTEISEYAFFLCKQLTSITIPDSVTEIKYRTFSWCENLTTLELPDSISSIGERAFHGCKKLISLVLPEGLTTIERETFRRCNNLTLLYIPESVTSIGIRAFQNCNKIIIILPRSTNFIYDNNALFNSERTHIVTYLSSNEEQHYNVPDSVTTIDEYAFFGSNLQSITIPSSVTIIENSAFARCNNLTTLTIPESIDSLEHSGIDECPRLEHIEVSGNNYVFDNGVLFNHDKTELLAYLSSNKATNYEIPESVTSISKYSFPFCEALTSITLHGKLTLKDCVAMKRCSNIELYIIDEKPPVFKSTKTVKFK